MWWASLLPAAVLWLALTSEAAAPELAPCFTPGENCTGIIAQAIDRAVVSVLVQAYHFTSIPILHALTRAKGRGVEVRVILDRVNNQRRYSAAAYLASHGIEGLHRRGSDDRTQ